MIIFEYFDLTFINNRSNWYKLLQQVFIWSLLANIDSKDLRFVLPSTVWLKVGLELIWITCIYITWACWLTRCFLWGNLPVDEILIFNFQVYYRQASGMATYIFCLASTKKRTCIIKDLFAWGYLKQNLYGIAM